MLIAHIEIKIDKIPRVRAKKTIDSRFMCYLDTFENQYKMKHYRTGYCYQFNFNLDRSNMKDNNCFVILLCKYCQLSGTKWMKNVNQAYQIATSRRQSKNTSK